MRTLLIVFVAFALVLTGAAAAGSLAAPGPAAKKPPAKCVKWAKKHGKRVCIRRAKPKPKPKPAPTTTTTTTDDTPAIAPAGHYGANTSQGTRIQFELVGDNLLDFAINELDSTCNPGDWLSGVHLSLGSPVLDDDGTFSLDYPVQFSGGGTGALAVRGSIDKAGRATGSFTWTENFTSDGTAYTCSSGTVTFSGGTGGAAPTPPAGPQLGHYHGMTSQNDHITFDVIASGAYLYATHVAIDEVDESCDQGATGWVKNFSFGDYGFFLTAGGHMRYAYHGETTFILDMVVGAGTATGTIEDTRIIPGEDGEHFVCSSGRVGFTATIG